MALLGEGSRLENAGTVKSLYSAAVFLTDNIASGDLSKVINSGTIQGSDGISLEGSSAARIENTGLIRSSYADVGGKSIQASTAMGGITIVNSGRLIGDVELGQSSDVFYNRAGTLVGEVHGGPNDDSIYGGAGAENFFGDAGDDKLYGGARTDKLYGGADNDLLSGENDNDLLLGESGDDYLVGGAGRDRLIGGIGADRLNGGPGADVFDFNSVAESTPAMSGRDLILGFSRTQGDRIDLSTIDAKSSVAGNNGFTFIGSASFHQEQGELRAVKAGGKTSVAGDIDGNGTSDFLLQIVGQLTLKATDFLL